MPIRILAVGKKHDGLLVPLIDEYEKRLRSPWRPVWQIIPSSSAEASTAIEDESRRLIGSIRSEQYVILLDERGRLLDTPTLSNILEDKLNLSHEVIIIIGGAFGVTEELRQRADLVLSLSNLVFPHQIVRLILSEQIYRCWSIAAGLKYHHM